MQEITKDVEGYLTVKNLMARPECNNRVSILVSILVSIKVAISRIIGSKLVRLFENGTMLNHFTIPLSIIIFFNTH